MITKRTSIGNRPIANPGAETWVRQGDGAVNGSTTSRANLYTARLTLDVTPALRGRIKVIAFRQGVTVAEMLRQLLERAFPEQENGS